MPRNRPRTEQDYLQEATAFVQRFLKGERDVDVLLAQDKWHQHVIDNFMGAAPGTIHESNVDFALRAREDVIDSMATTGINVTQGRTPQGVPFLSFRDNTIGRFVSRNAAFQKLFAFAGKILLR